MTLADLKAKLVGIEHSGEKALASVAEVIYGVIEHVEALLPKAEAAAKDITDVIQTVGPCLASSDGLKCALQAADDHSGEHRQCDGDLPGQRAAADRQRLQHEHDLRDFAGSRRELHDYGAVQADYSFHRRSGSGDCRQCGGRSAADLY